MTEKEIMTEELEISTGEELGFLDMLLPEPQEVEKRTQQYLSYLKSILKVTRSQDWNFFDRKTTGGRSWKLYRLSQFAAKRLRIPLGISITGVKREKLVMEDEKGSFYHWIYSGIATWGKMQLYVEGRASNRDKFFAFANGEGKPLSEVNQLNIMTAAHNNMIKKAVIDTFGLGDFPGEDLRQLGFDPEKVARGHEFPSGGGNKPSTPPPPQANGGGQPQLATEKQHKLIYAKGRAMGWDDEAIDKFILDRAKKSKKELTYQDINLLIAAFKEFEPPKEGGGQKNEHD